MTRALNDMTSMGYWLKGNATPEPSDTVLKNAVANVRHPVFIVNHQGAPAGINSGTAVIQPGAMEPSAWPLLAFCPPLHPETLGDAVFKTDHHIRYAYVGGAMANGITSEKMVEAMGRAGMLGFFGAAGLSLPDIETALDYLQQNMPGIPFGSNLIHNPNEPDQEAAVVDLYLRRKIRLISASAFLRLTLPLVYFRVKGIHLSPDGTIICPNKIVAKVSRVELARRFFAPPPEKLLNRLVELQKITPREAQLAGQIPLADDLTAEADSGGHTDNRPALSLLPTMLSLRDEMMARYNYQRPLCVGLGGGIATPASCAAAFAMGAAYVLTGTVNQACVEAGISPTVRTMLAEAGQADVTMAPAADMFEMGVKVQVLKRGTLFPQRAQLLFDLYSRHDCFEDIPAKDRQVLTDKLFRCSFDQVWHQTRNFFLERDPRQVERAEKDPRHKMALVFRSYLGRASGWAKTGDHSRKIDYQIWCGPAIGAFNQWCANSFLALPENRKVVTVGLNLLLGAAVATRANWLRMQRDGVPPDIGTFCPLPLEKIGELMG